MTKITLAQNNWPKRTSNFVHQERHRMKQLLAAQEVLYPCLYPSILTAMKPIMAINKTQVNIKQAMGSPVKQLQDKHDKNPWGITDCSLTDCSLSMIVAGHMLPWLPTSLNIMSLLCFYCMHLDVILHLYAQFLTDAISDACISKQMYLAKHL